eukprot:2757867-Prymnesium_polylepis.1
MAKPWHVMSGYSRIPSTACFCCVVLHVLHVLLFADRVSLTILLYSALGPCAVLYDERRGRRSSCEDVSCGRAGEPGFPRLRVVTRPALAPHSLLP